jgi:signal transduction histidine kinase/HD-like signal output (HDOD) protein
MQQSDHDIRNRLLIARLPAMPQILIKLIEQLQAEQVGTPELAALIATDAGMTSKILSVANSSAYQRSGRKVGLEQSLATLGTDMIKTLVISESVFQTFNNFPNSGAADLRAFWKSSLTAAVLARGIARRMAYAQPEEAYLAGLLHNVGRLALLAAAPKEYAFNFTARDDDALCAVEQRTMQITHAEAGAWLIERWQLDSFLADSVLYHHEPTARLESSHALIRAVRLAHLMCAHSEQADALAEMARLCGLTPNDLEALSRDAADQVEKSARMLGIELADADDVPAPQAYAPPADPVQRRLSEEVRNMMLVSEMGQTFSQQQGEAAVTEAITRAARIMFDFSATLVLLQDPTGHAMVGVPVGEQQQRLAGFSIVLAKGGPVAAAALERRLAFIGRAAGSPGPGLGIAEEQLLRLLGSDSMVCIPLVSGQRCLGLLVGGAPAWQVPSYQKRERFLQSFGVQAATALQAALIERGQANRQLTRMAEQYREASRRVVHEVNNPLSIIKNYLSVLDGKLARREPVVGEMSILNEEIDRVGQLINGLADLQPMPADPACTRHANVGEVVGEVLQLFRAADFVPPSVEVSVRLQDQPAEIDGDPDILKQILVNLVKNAVEALPEGGRIGISQRGHVNRERRLYLELCVSDSGPGLPNDVLASLFSPVRSTKDGAHHGLGLSIVHNLVTSLHGLISCRSGEGGTTFEILLPVRGSRNQVAGMPGRATEPVNGYAMMNATHAGGDAISSAARLEKHTGDQVGQ